MAVLLDDAQFADGTALDALECAALADSPTPICVVAFARPEFDLARPGWGRRAGCTRVLALHPLERAAAEGPKRRLVGLIVEGRGIARHGYPVHVGERRTGAVTSGTQSPTLGVPIAMAYVAPADAEPGTMVDIEIRDARVPARVVPLPFYRRSS